MYKPREIVVLIIFILILSSIFVFYNGRPCKASGNTIYVDGGITYPPGSGTLEDPYKAIQYAIDAADDGDTVKVFPGIYGGDLIIDKSITLMTDDATISSGSKTPYMIDITADSVSLEGFTINDITTTSHRKAVIHIAPNTNDVVIINNAIEHSAKGRAIYLDGAYKAVIKNNIINDTDGIDVVNSNANSIYDNHVENCDSYPALRLTSSNTNHIEDNIFESSTNGIYVHASGDNDIRSNKIFSNSDSGIVLSTGSHNTIENNSIYDNGNIGIYLDSSQNYVTKNDIFSNGIGISLGASDCTIQGNSIHHSKTYGIYAGSTSGENTIFNNTFYTSYDYPSTCHAKEEGSNYWDNGSIGNYWDDFYGPDPTSSSNLGTLKEEDFYYTNGGVLDKHPKGVFQSPPKIDTPSPAPSPAEGVDFRPTLSVKVEDPEGKRMDVYFYYVLNDTSNLIDVVKYVESGKRASVPFYSTVQGQNAVYTYMGQGYDYIGVWYVVAKDQYSENRSQEWIFSTHSVPINNTKPTADAGGPYEGQINDTIQFDGSGSNDTDGTIVFYRWSFGDGASAINVQSPTHIYKSEGTYNVSLVVIDNQGSSGTSSTTVEIGSQNRPPVVKISGDNTGSAGDFIQFNGSKSSDPDSGDKIESYVWNFGDGANGTGKYAIHKYSQPGKYTVTLTVTDKQGLSNSDSIYVEINAATNKKSPGYELIFVIIAVLLVFVWRRRR